MAATAESPVAPESKPRTLDLEIKDAQLIFNSVWNELVQKYGEQSLSFPREIFWLNGAPGSGKGTQTEHIMGYCGLTAEPLVVSNLLKSEEARRLKDAGMMAGDREVTQLLLNELLKPQNNTGVVVDGYPRTKVQVECLKHFYQKLTEMRRKYLGTSREMNFPKPIFHIVVLYVDEGVSVHRQMQRGRQALEHNKRVEETGLGSSLEIRKTDLDVETARNRYRTFKEITYESLTSLREIFHYHFINAQGSIEAVRARIVEELKYQSSLELDQSTYDFIARIPVASSITVHARQALVERLDGYTRNNAPLFGRVIELIDAKFMPIVRRHAISGRAYVNSEEEVFAEPLSLAMLIDIFSERGYQASVDVRQDERPERIDLTTGDVIMKRKKIYRFRIHFSGSVIRRGH